MIEDDIPICITAWSRGLYMSAVRDFNTRISWILIFKVEANMVNMILFHSGCLAWVTCHKATTVANRMKELFKVSSTSIFIEPIWQRLFLIISLYLALTNITKKWTIPIREWKSALNQFSIMFEERLPNSQDHQRPFTQSSLQAPLAEELSSIRMLSI